MKEIDKIDLNIGKAYLSEWNEGMAIRELIANAMDETIDGEIEIKEIASGKWSITNRGSEIKPNNFMINEGVKSKEKGKIGKFGIGLKDAIGVLMIRGIGIQIITSEFVYVAKYKKKNRCISDECLFMCIYNEKRAWIGTQVVLNNCPGKFIEEAKLNFIVYRDKYKVVDTTEYGDVIFEEQKDKNGTIYLNGIKIAHENTFLYSYNIKIEEDILKKGISRERSNLSREIYKDSLKRIINNIKSEEVLGKYYESLIKTRDGSLKGELVYSYTQFRAMQYIINNKINAIIFPAQRSGKINNLYNKVCLERGIKVIILLNSYYTRLAEFPELANENIIADNYKVSYTEIDMNNLDENKKRYLQFIEELIKEKISSNIISEIVLIKENEYLYNKEERKIIIPIEALEYLKECFIKIINIISDSVINGEKIKDEILSKYIEVGIKEMLDNSK